MKVKEFESNAVYVGSITANYSWVPTGDGKTNKFICDVIYTPNKYQYTNSNTVSINVGDVILTTGKIIDTYWPGMYRFLHIFGRRSLYSPEVFRSVGMDSRTTCGFDHLGGYVDSCDKIIMRDYDGSSWCEKDLNLIEGFKKIAEKRLMDRDEVDGYGNIKFDPSCETFLIGRYDAEW